MVEGRRGAINRHDAFAVLTLQKVIRIELHREIERKKRLEVGSSFGMATPIW